MAKDINLFVERIPDFESLSPSERIPYFIYYLTFENEKFITAVDVKQCFDQLALISYSNISAYLSKKATGKGAILVKGKNGYRLERTTKSQIASILLDIIPAPTTALFDISIIDNAPFYIKKNAEQMCCCYDMGLYDACLVMMRKLVETLIIECFERHGIADHIKDTNGNYLYLSDLIPQLLKCSYWVASRNVEANIKEVKKFGDLSAHNRRFLAKKSDIDRFKFELRQAIQEIALIIDYSTWIKRESVIS